MFHNSAAIKQFIRVAAAELVLTAIMLGVYALIGRFTMAVVLGAVLGCLLSLANFLMLSVTVSRAADRAQAGDPVKARAQVQGSSVLRLFALAVIYIITLRTGIFDPIAAVLPLVFLQVSISLVEFFRKDGDGTR